MAGVPKFLFKSHRWFRSQVAPELCDPFSAAEAAALVAECAADSASKAVGAIETFGVSGLLVSAVFDQEFGCLRLVSDSGATLALAPSDPVAAENVESLVHLESARYRCGMSNNILWVCVFSQSWDVYVTGVVASRFV